MISWLEQMTDAVCRLVPPLLAWLWAVVVLCFLVALHFVWRIGADLVYELREFGAGMLTPIAKLLIAIVRFFNWIFGLRK
jgi:hypothetical protein